MQYLYDNLDQGNTVISIFLDISKAFDCLDHDLLLEKMSVYGVDGVILFFLCYYRKRGEGYRDIHVPLDLAEICV